MEKIVCKHLIGNGGVAECVDPDNGQFTGMLEHLVIDGFLLNFAALVAGLHGTQHTAPLGNAIEFGQNGLFHQFGKLVHDKTALHGIFILGQAPFAVDDELNGQCPGEPTPR